MRRLLIGSLLAVAGGTAHAADNGFYLGAGISQSQVDRILDTDVEIDDTAWKLIAGFRPIDLIGVEANYMDLGSESTDFGLGPVSADAKAFSAFAVGFLPLPLVDIYGKLGLARWELEGQSNVGLFQLDDSGTEFAYGAGAQIKLGSLSARLEYEGFDIDNTDGLNLYSLGVTWTFL